MNIDSLDDAAERAVLLLKALASPVRLKLLCQLVGGERTVGDLARRLKVRDTLASQHLALLRREGLVTYRRDGQTLYYFLRDPAARRILEALHDVYCAEATASAPASPEEPARS